MDAKVVRKTIIIRELIESKWTQKDIADDLGVSEGYVSQIKKKIKRK